MLIMVVSSGRANKQETLRWLPQDSVPNGMRLELIVPAEQGDEYRVANPDRVVTEHFMSKIADTRNFMMAYAKSKDHERMLMLDDDLRFFERMTDGRARRTTDLSPILSAIDTALDEYCHVGLADRFMLQAQPLRLREYARAYQVTALNLATLPRPSSDYPIRHRIVTNSDLDLLMQVIAAGGRTCVITDYAKDSRAYAEGGCAAWRTPEVELEGQEALVRLWPGVAGLTESTHHISGKRIQISWRRLRAMGGRA